jgi:hypothetical protein
MNKKIRRVLRLLIMPILIIIWLIGWLICCFGKGEKTSSVDDE